MRRFIPGSHCPAMLKSPGAVLDYSFDWTDWLEEGDHVAGFEITTQGVSLVSASLSNDIVTAIVAGGVPGKAAWVRCKITTETEPSKTEYRTINLTIQQR
jgi:hypothetical protein